MFAHSVSTDPLMLDTTLHNNNLVVWEPNPLMNLPAFNVYTRDAPEKLEDAPWQPRSRSNSVNRSRSNSISPVKARGESESAFSTPGQVNTGSTLTTSGPDSGNVNNNNYNSPKGVLNGAKSNITTPIKTPTTGRSTKATPTTGTLHNTNTPNNNNTPASNERRPSTNTTSGQSTTSVGSAAQRRMNRMLETLSGM